MAPKTNKRKTSTTKQHVSSDEEEIVQISDKDVEFSRPRIIPAFLGTPNIGKMWKKYIWREKSWQIHIFLCF